MFTLALSSGVTEDGTISPGVGVAGQEPEGVEGACSGAGKSSEVGAGHRTRKPGVRVCGAQATSHILHLGSLRGRV